MPLAVESENTPVVVVSRLFGTSKWHTFYPYARSAGMDWRKMWL